MAASTSIRTPRLRAARIALTLAVVTAGSWVAAAQAPVLRLVSTAWAPFTNEPGQTRFALDLVETALARTGVKTTTTIVPAAEFSSALLTEAYDGSAAAWKDAERDRVLLFSQAYLENRLVLVGRKTSPVSATSLSALKGRRIGLVAGYSYGDIESTGPTFSRVASEQELLTQLLQNRIDYALMDDLVIEYLTSHYAKETASNLAIGKAPVVVRPLYFVVRRSRPDAESIVSGFNKQLHTMVADKSYHRLLHVDWIVADADGDGVPEYVPANDKVGKTPPQHAYVLTSPTQSIAPGAARFYLGGTTYSDWASVPDRYKVSDPQNPDPRRSTASIFKFVW